MDFKDFEIKLNTIKSKINDFFQQLETEEQNTVNEVFKTLSENFSVKSSAIGLLEAKLKANEKDVKSQIKGLEEAASSFEKAKKLPLYDIKVKTEQLEKEKHEELKPFLLMQKKKKSDLIHKINSLKKELAIIHKENHYLLIEEEKNYKLREGELYRRLNIDLERCNEANIKLYRNIEKGILDINDELAINTAQKKINEIRVIGIKEASNIKNKYSLSLFENSLEFQKLREKIILENSIKTEEFKLKIKALDIEKNELEDEEYYTIEMFNFDIEKKLLQIEKENKIDLNQFNSEKNSNIFLQKTEILKIKAKENDHKTIAVKEIQKQAFDLDFSQLQIFKPIDNFLSSNLKNEVSCLIEGLINCFDSFNQTINTTINQSWQNRAVINDRFTDFLIVKNKQKIQGSDFSYQDILIDIQNEAKEYYKLQKARQERLTNTINQITILMLQQVDSMVKLIKEHQLEDQKFIQFYNKRISAILEKGYKESFLDNQRQHRISSVKLSKDEMDLNKGIHVKDEESKVCNLKYAQEYDYQVNQLEARIKVFQEEFKTKADKDKVIFRKYIKSSKKRINLLKNSYSDNVIKHEKALYKKYQEDLVKNEIDRKTRVNSL